MVNVLPGASRLYRGAALLAICAMSSQSAHGASNIDSGSTYLASNLGGSVNPTFAGGTLQLDSSTTIDKNFTVGQNSTNTIDAQGHSVVLSGIFSDASSTTTGEVLNFTDTVGGGRVTLTGVSTLVGSVAIDTSATLALAGSGSIASAGSVGVGGTFDISQTTAGASIVSLTGAGSVVLGNQTLTLTNAAGTFSGIVSGTGGLAIKGGAETLTGNNTYTGGTTITGGTLYVGDGGTTGWILGDVATNGTLAFSHSDAVTFSGAVSGSGGLSQLGTGVLTITSQLTYSGPTAITSGTLALGPGGSIANSSSVNATGTLDISQTAGAAIRSLSGSGTVELGNQTLTITGANTTFSGTISGAGGLTVAGGTQTLTGTLSYTGSTTVTGGTLQLGLSTFTGNIANSGTVGFNSSGGIAMSGVISGTGSVNQAGGTTTISTVQTYAGATTISGGTLALSGAGSLSGTSGLIANGTFDISAAANVTLPTLAGNGTVQLGTQTLTLSNALGTFGGTIAGTGNFVLASGNETLSGASTMTGTVTVGGGTLSLSNASAIATAARVVDNGLLDISAAGAGGLIDSASIKSLGGSGSVALGTRTLILTSASDSFAGVISGSGGLTVSGGTETLTGVNTYTGTTTIAVGILALSGSGSLASTNAVAVNGTFDISAASSTVSIGSLSGTGAVTLGTNSLSIQNASGAFLGSIGGSGGLIIQGGSQILAGSSNYTGGTVISAGTLQIGRGASQGAIVGDVIDNGTLAFNRSDSLVFSGAISGNGSVAQLGPGTTILAATNSYTGGTIINAGTLQIGNGTNTGSIVGDVTDNGTLAFNRSDAVTFAGTISGSGAVNLIGTGTLSLTAISSYTGTTSIASGSALVLGSGASIASSSDVIDNGLLDISAVAAPRLASLGGSGSLLLGTQSLGITSGSDTFSGTISGSGGLTISGGNQILSGVNSYTGVTSVIGGTLTVNGSVTSSSGVAVSGPGKLAGSGTVPSVTVAGGGTLSPGTGGVGSLKINGNLSMAGDSNFVVTQSSAGSPSVLVTGAAALGGTLSVASSDGTYFLGQKTAVLSAAGGINGNFAVAPVPTTGAEFKSTVSYDASNVYLEIDLARLSPLLPSTATPNQNAPVRGIDAAIAAGSTLPRPFQNLGNLHSTDLASDASQLSGEIASDLPRAAAGLADPFLDALFNRLGDRSGQRGLWTSGFIGSDLVLGDATAGSQKFKAHASGVTGGYDWHITPKMTLGLALSAASSSFHIANGLGDGNGDAFQVGVYGNVQFAPRLYGEFAGAVGVGNMTTARTLTVSGTDRLMGKADPLVLALRYETGVQLGWITPYAALSDTLVSMPSYTETAAIGTSNFALQYAANDANAALLELGVRQSAVRPLGKNWTVTVSDQLAWSHILAQPWSATAAFAALPNSDFTVYGAKAGRDGAKVSLGLELQNRNGLGFNVHFEGQGTDRSQSYFGFGGINYTW
ncbi:MAG TPA: autotransporter-associated beta strand repeat-containing protein [Rhizomicrobium sp.]|nr:autotransporter-associated beta strand repeat-containing protein [Rhizomicrobium sp.]